MHPFARAVSQLHRELVAQFGLVRGGARRHRDQAMRVARLYHPNQQLAVGQHILGLDVVKRTHMFAYVAVAAPSAGLNRHAVDHARDEFHQLLQLFLAALQGLLGQHARSDLLDRAFVVQQLTLGVAHRMRALADPDALARAMSIDLRLESHQPAFAAHQALELGAPFGLHIPLGGDVGHGCQQLGLGLVAVEAHQGRVGAQHPAVGARAVSAYRQRCQQV